MTPDFDRRIDILRSFSARTLGRSLPIVLSGTMLAGVVKTAEAKAPFGSIPLKPRAGDFMPPRDENPPFDIADCNPLFWDRVKWTLTEKYHFIDDAINLGDRVWALVGEKTLQVLAQKEFGLGPGNPPVEALRQVGFDVNPLEGAPGTWEIEAYQDYFQQPCREEDRPTPKPGEPTPPSVVGAQLPLPKVQNDPELALVPIRNDFIDPKILIGTISIITILAGGLASSYRRRKTLEVIA